MQKFSSRRAVAFAVALGLSAPTVWQPRVPAFAAAADEWAGNVVGTVTSSDGVPIRNAVVVLQAEGTSKSGRTDATGKFTIPSVVAGTYAVRVSAPGFDPVGPQPIGVQRVGTTDIALALVRSSSSLVTIGRISSNGDETLSTSATPSTTINAQTYAAQGYTRVSDVLQDDMSTTLVHPTGTGSTVLPTSVALRGPDPTETLVDIDGHQVNSGSTGDFDLSLLDPADYSTIELVRGISPSSLVGPDTIDGAINIRTLEPTLTPHGLLRLSAGSFNSFGETLQSTGTVDRLGYAVSLHGTTTKGEVNGPIFDTNTNGMSAVGSGVDGRTALGKLRYTFGSNGGSYAEFSFHDQSAYRDLSAGLSSYSEGPTTDPGSGFPAVAGFAGSSIESHNAGYGLDVRVPLGSHDASGAEPASLLFRHYTSLVSQSVSGQAAATSPYLYNDRDLIGENSLEFDKQFSNGSLTLQYMIRNEDLTIAGAEAGDGSINLESVARALPTAPQPLSVGGRPSADALPAVDTSATGQTFTTTDTHTTVLGQTQRSAVLRYIYDPTTALHLTAAAYYSDYSLFGHQIDPRFGFVYTPDSRSAFRFSVGTTYQAPQLPELYVPTVLPAPVGGVITTGNPNLQPDHATEYGLGFSHILESGAHRTDISADLYRVNLRTPASSYTQAGSASNSCGSVASGGDGTPCLLSYALNAGDGVYQGFELAASRVLAPHVSVRAGFAVRSAYLTSVPSYIQDGTFVLSAQDLGLPLQKGTLGFTVAPPRGLTFRTSLVYEGRYNELNSPPFATLAAAVGYRFPSIELIFSGTNLTNVYDHRFTVTGGGVPQSIVVGTQPTDAYALQGTAFNFSITRRF